MNDNDVVIINLDRPRELRYGHKALKILMAMTGKDMDAGIKLEDIDLNEIEIYLYCGLLSDAKKNGEVLKLEEMEDLLDLGDFQGNVSKMIEAFNKSFGNMDDMLEGDATKNLQRIALEAQKKRGNSPGRKA